MIDLHCHVLPGIDDGPATMDDALALARAHVAAGTTTVVATSHVSWDYPDNVSVTLAPLVARLREELAAAGIPLDVRTGGEVAMTRAGELPDAELDALKLGGGPWLLVECPFTPTSAGFDAVLGDLESRGHRILLAHPERCPALHRDLDLLERCVERGMLTSLTAGAFTGVFGRDVQRFAHDLLRRGLAHSVASDAHDLERRVPGTAGELTSARIAPELVTWLCGDVPAAVLDGGPLPPRPAVEKPAGLLGRFRRAS